MTNLTSIIDGSAGSAQGKVGTTIQTFLISLSAGFVLFGVQFGAFLIFRNYLWSKRIYQPRSFLIPLKDRVKPPPNNPLKWLVTVFKIEEDPEVLRKAGMDAYFFLRYLSMCLKIFFPMALVIIPILIPLNYVSGKGTRIDGNNHFNVTGLDTLAWSNVSPEHTSRYWAHLVLAVIVVVWVGYIFYKELYHYIRKRQEFLGSPSHRLKASSTTVLITDIPEDLCSPEALTELYDDFPGGIRRIWINRDFSALVSKDEVRKSFESRLENAETNLLRKVVKSYRKQQKRKARGALNDSAPTPTEPLEMDVQSIRSPSDSGRVESAQSQRALQENIDSATTPVACQTDLEYDMETKAAWTQYLGPKQRESMRIPKGNHTAAFKIPLIGRFFSTKVDTIYYCRRELARLNKEIENEVDLPESYSHNQSAFIQFNNQKAAHLACQAVADIRPRQMTNRTVEISPADINWAALNLSWRGRYLRLAAFILIFALLILVFGIISFATGILSKASTLSNSYHWLRWIGDLPPWLLSFIQGTLPPVIQVILLSGPLPIILRALTNSTRGATTGSQGERSLQLWYFIFLVIEIFLIPTISAGLTSIVNTIISNTMSVPEILAQDLPTASNYFFSFLILQALSISASSILQTIRLFNFYVIGGVNTPDSVFEKLSWTNRTRIGSNIPWYTTFAVIGLVYSVIAPLMLIFMIITFSLFWFVIKNNILYVIRTGNVDGGGLFFPSAINQLFTGLYFMEICLIGLFFLVRNRKGNLACEAQGIIMAVVLVFTIFYQIWLTTNFNGLFKFAPVRQLSEAAKRDEDIEMERLTTAPEAIDQPALSSDKELGSSEKIPIDSPSSKTELHPPPQRHRNSDADLSPDLKLGRRTSTFRSNYTAALPRAQDMQDQQRADRESAKHILARLNRPLNETRLAQLENDLAQVEERVGNVLIPRRKDIEAQMMNDPISKIIMQHNDELEDLEPEERDILLSVAFTHPIMRQTKPSVWIPQDEVGVSDDEVRRMRKLSSDLFVDNRGAYFNRKLKVKVDKPPPDMSEFALVMAEL
ncbi:DUF221-domain-containing protein [Mytilinidion resinicola]|uniref:DUF221-domain-containing protein n=1 Tax=Mytilinidion resinicola TaxID=574789 RepID=A0A6A6Y933_9PEZI|nr:DUF221-domain-containing protein [Mytilinidion resinicola]KAF2805149.1 DUF221-domain-containing protein [Mytilinidion resinicola]